MPLVPVILKMLAAAGFVGVTEAALKTFSKPLIGFAKKAMTKAAKSGTVLTEEQAVAMALKHHKGQVAKAMGRLGFGKTPPAAAATTTTVGSAEEIAAKLAAAEKLRHEQKKGSFLGGATKFVAGTAGAGIIFDLVGRAMHPSESYQGEMGSDAAGMQQLQEMLQQGGMVGGMGGSETDLKQRFNRSQGAENSYNIGSQLNQGPPTSGVSSDLDTLIRGHENLLGQIAMRQPMTMTQALAQQGVVMPRNSQGMESLYG